MAPQRTLTEVAIGLIRDEGRFLICRRPESVALGGYWEFPGGKCAPGECARECLLREIREEVGLEVRPVHAFAPIEFAYAQGMVRLHPFLCERVSGKATPMAADEMRWVEAEQLGEYRFPPANDGLIKELLALLARGGAELAIDFRPPKP